VLLDQEVLYTGLLVVDLVVEMKLPQMVVCGMVLAQCLVDLMLVQEKVVVVVSKAPMQLKTPEVAQVVVETDIPEEMVVLDLFSSLIQPDKYLKT
jgi:hypothetical protein